MKMEALESRADLYRKQTQQNDLKQHADKIIRGIKEIGLSHAKRAIWELFQNAVDLSHYCEIAIKVNDRELVFSHNGMPFTMRTLDCLFTQVSSKTLTEKKRDRGEDDQTGQYGTGFMTSHSFGDVVRVSGAIQVELEDTVQPGRYVEFHDLTIDRSTQNWEQMCDEISGLRKSVENLLSQEPTRGELPPTTFSFELGNELNKKRAVDAIDSLETILPYVMIFNDRLKKVVVTDVYSNKATYEKGTEELNNGRYFSRQIYINDTERWINYLQTDEVIVILPFQTVSAGDDYRMKAEALPESLPRLFLFYPLIGTENFGFNFVVHSKNFQPTEPRDGLHLQSDNVKNQVEEQVNREIMSKASEMIFELLRDNLPNIDNPHLLAEVSFVSYPDDEHLSQYFASLKEKWTSSFMTLPLVETSKGRIPVQEAFFLDLSIISDVDAETILAIYNIAEKYYPNLPTPELISSWSGLVKVWSIDDIKWVNFSDIAEKIHEQGAIDVFDKSELVLLYKAMIAKGESDLFSNKALIPNIKGRLKRQGDLNRAINLPDELIPVADAINPKISDRQIDSDFILQGLEFGTFGRRNYMELINNSLDENLKDGTRLGDLPDDYVIALIRYACIVSREDSTSGPLRIIKLIARHENMQFSPIVVPTLPDDDIDVRKGQTDFFKIYLNDVCNRDEKWVKENIDAFSEILTEAFNIADVKKIFLRYDVFPNQVFRLKSITNLSKDKGISDFVKDLFDKVVKPQRAVREMLAHSAIENLYDEMRSKTSRDLTIEIEQRFFGDSGNDIHMDNNHYRSDIIDIVHKIKHQEDLYENLFPATYRNRSNIMVQLADGEASFAILSQDEQTIRKLAQIAARPDLDELLRLGQEAIDRQRYDEATLKRKKQLGNHLEKVLRQHLSKNVSAEVTSEQDGQDLVIYVENQPVYYIEVKSRWLDTTPVRLTRNQTLQAHHNQDRFALCTIDMTKYTEADRLEVKSIENVVDCMWFNTNVGQKVEHLVDIYDADARQEDEFRLDGDYRTHIPYRYIVGEGINLLGFEKTLLSCVNNKL